MLKPIVNCETPEDFIRTLRRVEALGTAFDELACASSPKLTMIAGQLGGIVRDYAITARVTVENLQAPLERAINFGESGTIETLREHLKILKTSNFDPDDNIAAIDESILELDKFVEDMVYTTTKMKREFREIKASEIKRLKAMNEMEAEKKGAAVDAATSSSDDQQDRKVRVEFYMNNPESQDFCKNMS